MPRYLTLFFTYLIIANLAFSIEAKDRDPSAEDLRVDVVSQKSFDDTVQHLRWRFGEHGLVISWASNYREALKKSKPQMRNAVVFELLRPTWLEQVLDSYPRAVLALPFRITVLELANGETLVSYYRPSTLFAITTSSDLKELGKDIDEKLARIVRLAAAE